MSEFSESKEYLSEHVVELAGTEDAREIARIQCESWLDTYGSEELGITESVIKERLGDFEKRVSHWEKEVFKDGKKTFVLKEGDRVIGFVKIADEPDFGHIDAMYLDPDSVGKGAGGLLMERVIGELDAKKPIILEVAKHNERAIGFYKRFGFMITDKELPLYRLNNEVYMELYEMERPVNQ